MENKMTPEQEKEMYRHRLEYLESRIGSMTDHEQWEAVQEIKRLTAAPPAIPNEVLFTLEASLAALNVTSVMLQGAMTEGQKGAVTAARAWLTSAPVATDKAVCSACGKVGKTFGEVIDNKDNSITHPLCGYCCRMWDDVDTKDDVWSAICVRRNSGEHVVISPPRTEKGEDRK
jgi:hypothetical protein